MTKSCDHEITKAREILERAEYENKEDSNELYKRTTSWNDIPRRETRPQTQSALSMDTRTRGQSRIQIDSLHTLIKQVNNLLYSCNHLNVD